MSFLSFEFLQERNLLPEPKVDGDDRQQARALATIHSHPVVSLSFSFSFIVVSINVILLLVELAFSAMAVKTSIFRNSTMLLCFIFYSLRVPKSSPF